MYAEKRIAKLTGKIELLLVAPQTKETKKAIRSSRQAIRRWLKIIEEN